MKAILSLAVLCLPGATIAFAPAQRRALYPSTKTVPIYATVPEVVEKSDVDFGETPSLVGKAIPYSELTIGVMKETYPGENRVSQSPDSVANLVKAGFNVIVQAGGKEDPFRHLTISN